MLSFATRRAAIAPVRNIAARRNIYYIARGDAARHATPKMGAPILSCVIGGGSVFAMGAVVRKAGGI